MELICTKSTKHQGYVFPFSRRKGSPALVIHTNGTENFSRFDESGKKLVIPQMVFFLKNAIALNCSVLIREL